MTFRVWVERRSAAADRVVEVLGVAGERGAELVDQDLQAVAKGIAQRALDEVLLDGLAGLLDRDVGVLDPLVVAAGPLLERVALAAGSR